MKRVVAGLSKLDMRTKEEEVKAGTVGKEANANKKTGEKAPFEIHEGTLFVYAVDPGGVQELVKFWKEHQEECEKQKRKSQEGSLEEIIHLNLDDEAYDHNIKEFPSSFMRSKTDGGVFPIAEVFKHKPSAGKFLEVLVQELAKEFPQGLKDIAHVSAKGCGLVLDGALPAIGKFPRLLSLNLNGSQSDEGGEWLAPNAAPNKVTDDSVLWLAVKFPNLEFLDVRNNDGITGYGLEVIVERLSQLKHLAISSGTGSKITNEEFLKAILKLKNLESVDLRGNYGLTDEEILEKVVANLPNLSHVFVRSDLDIPAIDNMVTQDIKITFSGDNFSVTYKEKMYGMIVRRREEFKEVLKEYAGIKCYEGAVKYVVEKDPSLVKYALVESDDSCMTQLPLSGVTDDCYQMSGQ